MSADASRSVAVPVPGASTPSLVKVPVVELSAWLERSADSDAAVRAEAAKVADCLRTYGVLVVRDPRVPREENEAFIDQMEAYFGQEQAAKMVDVRPALHYQVGATPEFIETPRCTADPRCKDVIDAQKEGQKAHMPTGPDPKWRFFWRIGERPPTSEFAELNAPQVMPSAFPDWAAKMDRWGSLMLQAVTDCAALASLGFGFHSETFPKMMQLAPHLLAPTGSDLAKYGALDQVFAGLHTDLNFLTIHGKSRFPGLYVWLRDGTRITVEVPQGCLLVQAGQQMEYVTGGAVKAGWHEVVVTPSTLRAIDEARQARRSLWRVSSTLFSHLASDLVMKPMGQFETPAALEAYPPIKVGRYVEKELSAIRLRGTADSTPSL